MPDTITNTTPAPAGEPSVQSATNGGVQTFTQDQVSNIVAKEIKSAQEKFLADLGFDGSGTAKEKVTAYKAYVDSQKTEAERTAADLAAARQEASEYRTRYESHVKKSAVRQGLEALGAKPTMIDLLSMAVDMGSITLEGDALPDLAPILSPLKEQHPDAFQQEEKPIVLGLGAKSGGGPEPEKKNAQINNALRSALRKG